MGWCNPLNKVGKVISSGANKIKNVAVDTARKTVEVAKTATVAVKDVAVGTVTAYVDGMKESVSNVKDVIKEEGLKVLYNPSSVGKLVGAYVDGQVDAMIDTQQNLYKVGSTAVKDIGSTMFANTKIESVANTVAEKTHLDTVADKLSDISGKVNSVIDTSQEVDAYGSVVSGAVSGFITGGVSGAVMGGFSGALEGGVNTAVKVITDKQAEQMEDTINDELKKMGLRRDSDNNVFLIETGQRVGKLTDNGFELDDSLKSSVSDSSGSSPVAVVKPWVDVYKLQTRQLRGV